MCPRDVHGQGRRPRPIRYEAQRPGRHLCFGDKTGTNQSEGGPGRKEKRQGVAAAETICTDELHTVTEIGDATFLSSAECHGTRADREAGSRWGVEKAWAEASGRGSGGRAARIRSQRPVENESVTPPMSVIRPSSKRGSRPVPRTRPG